MFQVEKTKEKKQAKPENKQQGAPVDVSRLDMRVAQIKTVKYHPDADSLYVEEIDTGEECYRNVVTGLVKHVPIEQVGDLIMSPVQYYVSGCKLILNSLNTIKI